MFGMTASGNTLCTRDDQRQQQRVVDQLLAADVRIGHEIRHHHADHRGEKGRENVDVYRVPDDLQCFGVRQLLLEDTQAQPALLLKGHLHQLPQRKEEQAEYCQQAEDHQDIQRQGSGRDPSAAEACRVLFHISPTFPCSV